MIQRISDDDIYRAVTAVPELDSWPEARALFAPKEGVSRLDWQLPAVACQAVTGDSSLALPAVAAIACLQISIILVDDMLDDDPRGEFRRLGVGRTANLALAFQSAGSGLLRQVQTGSAERLAASEALAQAALATAFGQELDVQNLKGEESYWRVVEAKSTPFYGAALQVGALLAGAGQAVSGGLYRYGVLLGEIIQVWDDLIDAFQVPAGPDWLEGRNNLALLYASHADHPERELFQHLMGRAADAAALADAQAILVRSGAVSYCVYQLAHRAGAARRQLAPLQLHDPAPLAEILDAQVAPIASWLGNMGLKVPDELRAGRA